MKTPLPLSPAEQFRLADDLCRSHSDECQVCEMPSVDRRNAGCRKGRKLAADWDRLYLVHIGALSGRRS